jgi:5-(carboxyamino)imidazole ribonucleotide synthase
MVNLLGDLWQSGPPNWSAALAHRAVKLHLYGKTEPRPGRKMGHMTVLADTPQLAIEQALAARDALATERSGR